MAHCGCTAGSDCAAGDCAANCGVFADSYACVGPVSSVIPVDLHIAGCPPTPTDLLKGLIALVDRVDQVSDPPGLTP